MRLVVFGTKPPKGITSTGLSALPELTPIKVRFLLITTCSGYFAGQILMVDPGGTAFTAPWMVVNCTTFATQVPTATTDAVNY